MVRQVENGDAASIDAAEALALAAKVPDERMLYDVLPRLTGADLRAAIQADPLLGYDVVRNYDADKLDWGHRNYDGLNGVVETVVEFAHVGAAENHHLLLDAATAVALQLDEDWDRFRGRASIRSWLSSPAGDNVLRVVKAPKRRSQKQKDEPAAGLSGRTDPVILDALK